MSDITPDAQFNGAVDKLEEALDELVNNNTSVPGSWRDRREAILSRLQADESSITTLTEFVGWFDGWGE